MTDASEPIDLTGYQIVIPGNSTNNNSVESLSAYELKDALTSLGYKLPEDAVVADNGSSSVNAKSILIGKTAATEGDMPTGNQFSITENNGTVQISASNYYGYRAAIEYIQQKGGIPTYTEYTNDASLKYLSKPDASVRVMFYNVYGYDNWKNPDGTTVYAPSLALRQDMQKDLLSAYAPDVIGFQEYTADCYHANFNSILSSLDYAQVPVSKGTANYTPIFYNDKKLELVDYEYVMYNEYNGGGTKSITWAIFKVKSGEDANKMFAVFNTHFEYQSQNDGGNVYRCSNARELLTVIQTVLGKRTEYKNIPLFMGGDLNYWNINDTKEPHQILTSGGLTYLAERNNTLTEYTNRWEQDGDYSTYTESYHGYYRYDPTEKIYYMSENSMTTSRYSLDYIFLGGDEDSVAVKKYIIVNNDLTYRASDHSPTFVDFVFN